MGHRSLGVIALSVVVVFSCCDKGPEPKPVKYNVYYGMSDQGHLYVLDADSLTIIDSIPGLDEITGLAVSPDGAWIYAESGKRPVKPLSLKKIDVLSKKIVGELPDVVFNTVSLLDEGRLLTRGIRMCHRGIIETGPFVLVRSLDDSICAMRGPVSGTKVVAYVDGTSRFASFDVTTGELEGEYIPHLESGQIISVFDAVLHQDGRRVLALGGTAYPNRSWFVVGDLETGETLLLHQMFYAQGQIAVSDDGLFAAVTDPSNQGWWITNPTIDLFGLDSLAHLKRFTGGTEAEFEGLPGWVRFLPGSSMLIAAPSATESGPVLLIDVRKLRIERMVYPPFSAWTPTALAAGIRP